MKKNKRKDKKTNKNQKINVNLKDSEVSEQRIDTNKGNLEDYLRIIDDEVMNGYIAKLEQLPIIPYDNDELELNDINFFKISELVYKENELSVDKLAMVLNTLSNKLCTIAFMLKNDGEETEFYLGIKANCKNSSEIMFQMLKESFLGFFPGNKISDWNYENIKNVIDSSEVRCISSVTAVADYKQYKRSITNKDFVQGLEKFIYAMKGRAYTTILIADNLSHEELIAKKYEYLTAIQTIEDNFAKLKGSKLNTQNIVLNLTVERLKKQLERIERDSNLGMWNFAGYFLGETIAEAEIAANTYKSVMAGLNNGIERNTVNLWDDENIIGELKKYIYNFIHPEFLYSTCSDNGVKDIAVNPSTLVNTNELAIHMSLPRNSVKGLPVTEYVGFGEEVIRFNDDGEKTEFELGSLLGNGEISGAKVKLDCDSLVLNTFITGTVDSGKSNTVYEILNQLRTFCGTPFLIIEPTKGKYKNTFGQFSDVDVYGTNPKVSNLLKINPFSFPEGIHLLEHLDRLIDIFNVCWPLDRAMATILKESIRRAYILTGWNFNTSENDHSNNAFPNFIDLLEQVEKVIDESKYSVDKKGEYYSELIARITSLTTGLNGQIFNNEEIENYDLFDRNVIVDLSRVADYEVKSLIMGLLMMKLNEYRISSEKIDSALSHVTVLEEAHNLFKNTSMKQSTEGANLLEKSVRMLVNSISDMRIYGEGFVFTEQSPELIDMSVIRSSNTKIVLRLPDKLEREMIGDVVGLSEKKTTELSKLKNGVAVVYQNDWVEPVLVQINKCHIKEKQYDLKLHSMIVDTTVYRNQLINLMIQGRLYEKLLFNIQEIEFGLDKVGLSSINQKFVSSLVSEYKENGELEIWQDARCGELSRVVSEILNVRKNVEKCVLAASNNEELTDDLKQIVYQFMPEASNEVALTLSQCFMKDMSEQPDEPEIRIKIYKGWVDYVK